MITDKYNMIEEIASGSFGIVYKAERKEDRKVVAIKIINSNEESTEIDILDKLKHETIIEKIESDRYHIVDEHQNFYCDVIVLEYYPMNLLNFLRHGFLECSRPATKIRTIKWQLVSGVSYMHNKNIAHCDLKLSNILIDKYANLKICDFGMSAELIPGEPNKRNVQTSGYRAPEVLLGYPFYDKSIDIWSLGCIFYVLWTRQRLISHRSELDELSQIYSKCGTFSSDFLMRIDESGSLECEPVPRVLRETLESHVDDSDVIDLIDGCLQMDPDKRLTASQAAEMNCFRVYF